MELVSERFTISFLVLSSMPISANPLTLQTVDDQILNLILSSVCDLKNFNCQKF